MTATTTTERTLDLIIARCIAGAALALVIPAATSATAIAYAGLNGLSIQAHSEAGIYVGLLLDSVLLFVFLINHVSCVQNSIKLVGVSPLYLWFRLFHRPLVPQPVVQQDTAQAGSLSLIPRTEQGWKVYDQYNPPAWRQRAKQAIAAANALDGDFDEVLENPDAQTIYDLLVAKQDARQRSPLHGLTPRRWTAAVQCLKDKGLVESESRSKIQLIQPESRQVA